MRRMKAICLGSALGMMLSGSDLSVGLRAQSTGSVLVEVMPALALWEASPLRVIPSEPDSFSAGAMVCNLRGEYMVVAPQYGDFAFEVEDVPFPHDQPGSLTLACGGRMIRMKARLWWEPFALDHGAGLKLYLGGTVPLSSIEAPGHYSGTCRLRVTYR